MHSLTFLFILSIVFRALTVLSLVHPGSKLTDASRQNLARICEVDELVLCPPEKGWMSIYVHLAPEAALPPGATSASGTCPAEPVRTYEAASSNWDAIYTEGSAKTDFTVRTAKSQKGNSAIPSDTSSSLPNSVGWTSKPTAAPFVESPLELRRGSETPRDTYAEFDGNAAYPFTCANGYACSANLVASYVDCCEIDAAGNYLAAACTYIMTTCYDYTDTSYYTGALFLGSSLVCLLGGGSASVAFTISLLFFSNFFARPLLVLNLPCSANSYPY
jgi:hypothetical protein